MAVLHQTEVSGSKRWIYRIIVAFLAIGVPFQVFPYAWMLLNSLKTSREVKELPITLLPRIPQWGNIMDTLVKYHLWSYLGNTLFYCFGTILVQVTISSLAAFALSKLRFKHTNIVLLFFLGTLMMSDNNLVIPTYLMMIKFPIIHVNLIDHPLSLILANSAWAWAIFIFKGFFDSLPYDLVESARIDGSSNIGIFARIIIPLSKPVIAVVSLNTFMAVYNGLIMPITLLTRQERWTIMQKVLNASVSSEIGWNQLMVILGVTTIPVLVFYIFSQKYIVEGVTMTGLKG